MNRWFAIRLTVIVVAGAVAVSWALTGTELALFWGRFHPVVVHIPIGFLVALFMLELYALRAPAADLDAARWILLGGCTATSAIAVLFGFFIADEGGYEASLLFWHQWAGIATAVLTAGALAVRIWIPRPGFYWSVLAAGLLAMVLAGHDGASLTHGPGYLTEFLGETEGAPPEFERDIKPILKAKCLGCHGPDRQEGGLRVDQRKDLLKGGESEQPSVVPGDLYSSYLFELITLPRHHKEVMPPRKAAPLTREEMRILIRWIHDGAAGLE